VRSYSFNATRETNRFFFFTIKRVHPTRGDISESSSNSLKNFLQLHRNVRDVLPSSSKLTQRDPFFLADRLVCHQDFSSKCGSQW